MFVWVCFPDILCECLSTECSMFVWVCFPDILCECLSTECSVFVYVCFPDILCECLSTECSMFVCVCFPDILCECLSTECSVFVCVCFPDILCECLSTECSMFVCACFPDILCECLSTECSIFVCVCFPDILCEWLSTECSMFVFVFQISYVSAYSPSFCGWLQTRRITTGCGSRRLSTQTTCTPGPVVRSSRSWKPRWPRGPNFRCPVRIMRHRTVRHALVKNCSTRDIVCKIWMEKSIRYARETPGRLPPSIWNQQSGEYNVAHKTVLMHFVRGDYVISFGD